MKKRTIIILLIFAQIGAFYLKGHSQQLAKPDTWLNTYADTMSYKSLSTTTRLGDETTISYKGNNATITCDNEDIAKILLRRYDQIIKRCTWGYKTDRHGPYKHYLIVVSKDDAKLITEWAKTNL
jgi:hypothetical protein